MKKKLEILIIVSGILLIGTPIYLHFRFRFGESVSVKAKLETSPVPHDSDAADDVCIWIHPEDSSKSIVIGTDKDGGLQAYDLNGLELQYIQAGAINNVDCRYDFKLADQSIDIVIASDQDLNGGICFKVNPVSQRLEKIGEFKASINVYGLCLYKSQIDDKLYVIFASKNGEIEQWLLAGDSGELIAEKVRTVNLGAATEGCVADDEMGALFLAVEEEGLVKIPAEPDAELSKTYICKVSPMGDFIADIEGVTIYYKTDGTGYIILSCQGRSRFAVFERQENHEFLGFFKIGEGKVDAVQETDGIDVSNANLGETFPNGLFIAQDDKNPGQNQNFKFVDWLEISKAMGLDSQSNWNPRKKAVDSKPIEQ